MLVLRYSLDFKKFNLSAFCLFKSSKYFLGPNNFFYGNIAHHRSLKSWIASEKISILSDSKNLKLLSIKNNFEHKFCSYSGCSCFIFI